jgi:hypothetical protein
MATEINTKLDKPVIAILKKGLKPGEKVQAMIDAGVPRNQISLYMWRLEHVADPSLVVKPTVAGVKDARLNQQLRFERIAYRAGLVESEGSLGGGVMKVRELLTQGGVDPDAYVGRGRRFDGSSNGTTKVSERKSSKTEPATSGRRGSAKTKAATAKTATSGRRGAKVKAEATASKTKTAGRRGTRASAKSGAADPK